ncbi:MAG TPA: phosphatidate cytidylyltransferase [Candidatus Baltobacteraceae bacterium]|nr:phosphatidate cytidylyltransferase [Candidatus Baltobacteraceae bacterium]
MTRRIVVGLALAVVGLGCVAWPPAFFALLIVLGSIMVYELSRLCDIKGQPLEFQVAVIGTLAYVFLAIFHGMSQWEGVLLAFIVLATFWLGMYGEKKGYFARTAYTLLAVLYIGKLLTYFVFIREVPVHGAYWTVYVIVLIAMTDISAMVVGSLIGRHHLTKISPKKTVEGSVGALVLATALGAVLALVPYLGIEWWQGAALGAGTSIAAQAGDLVESALKRDAGVKDSGTVIQGHGGVLDRFDSYLFGGMAFFGTLHIIGLLGFG